MREPGSEILVPFLLKLIYVPTLSQTDFKRFVSSKIKENDAIQIRKRREEIDVIPEFSKMFKNSEIITSN